MNGTILTTIGVILPNERITQWEVAESVTLVNFEKALPHRAFIAPTA